MKGPLLVAALLTATLIGCSDAAKAKIELDAQAANVKEPKNEADKSSKAKPEPKDKKNGLAVTAEQLAQDFIDDPGRAYKHYGVQPVQVTGVVSKRNDPVAHIQVSGKGMDGRPVEWTFVMVLPKSVKADEVAVGKKVTLRGNLAATGGGTTTIDVSEVVRE